MKKASDSSDIHNLIGSAVRALDPILPTSSLGAEFAAAQLLTEQASTQLAMAAIEPLSTKYSAAIAAGSASIRDALKPSMAMQSALERIRPIMDMQAQLFPVSSIGADFRAQVRISAHRDRLFR